MQVLKRFSRANIRRGVNTSGEVRRTCSKRLFSKNTATFDESTTFGEQPPVEMDQVTLEDIEDAYQRIKPLLPPTPLSVSQPLSAELFKNYETNHRQSIQPLL